MLTMSIHICICVWLSLVCITAAAAVARLHRFPLLLSSLQYGARESISILINKSRVSIIYWWIFFIHAFNLREEIDVIPFNNVINNTSKTKVPTSRNKKNRERDILSIQCIFAFRRNGVKRLNEMQMIWSFWIAHFWLKNTNDILLKLKIHSKWLAIVLTWLCCAHEKQCWLFQWIVYNFNKILSLFNLTHICIGKFWIWLLDWHDRTQTLAQLYTIFTIDARRDDNDSKLTFGPMLVNLRAFTNLYGRIILHFNVTLNENSNQYSLYFVYSMLYC